MKRKRERVVNTFHSTSTARIVGAAGMAVVRAAVTAKAADLQMDHADAMKPAAFAKKEDRLAWECEQALADGLRRREVSLCNRAADQLLREAGFKNMFARKR